MASLEHWDAGLILAWHSGLRICCCCSYGVDHNCGLDLIPGPETPYATGKPKNKTKQNKTKQNKKTIEIIIMFHLLNYILGQVSYSSCIF